MKRNGFTIIEMLVVVIVIAILSGLVFKLIGAGGSSSDRAKARRQVEALANACEEYRAEYGSYPPVPKSYDPGTGRWYQPVTYSYPENAEKWTGGSASSLANQLRDIPRTNLEEEGHHVFQFGVLPFLVPRIEGHAETAPPEFFESNYNKTKVPKSELHSWFSQNSSKNENDQTITKWLKDGKIKRGDNWDAKKHCRAVDNPRDYRLAKKIAPLLNGVTIKDMDPQSYSGNVWTNQMLRIVDPWGHSLNYESDPPHASCRIWSSGPDGMTGNVKGSDGKTRNYSADDIVAGYEN